MLEVYFGLFVLALAIGSILGWVAMSRLGKVQQQLTQLQRRVKALEAGQQKPPTDAPSSTPQQDPLWTPLTGQVEESTPATNIPGEEVESPPVHATVGKPSQLHKPSAAGRLSSGVAWVQQYWMVALGALCIALAGIFLVRYSIERGLLGPTGRILLATFTGITLHALAEVLRRRFGGHPALAALAGGASITLYAATLAALHLYDLLSPGFAFVTLALIALTTMAMALCHGLWLAAIGILGAYIVPLLMFDDSGSVVTVLVYSLIITSAALHLLHYVYRNWLWLGMLAGALGWWAISLTTFEATGVREIYLTALVYLLMAIPGRDWLLHQVRRGELNPSLPCSQSLYGELTAQSIALILVVIAQSATILLTGFDSASNNLHWVILVVLLLWVSRSRPDLQLVPWLSVISQWFAWLGAAITFRGAGFILEALPVDAQQQFAVYALTMAVIYLGVGWLLCRHQAFSHIRFSLPTLAPLCWLALAYLLISDLSASWDWSLLALAAGLIYAQLARTQLAGAADARAAWLILGAHLAYSLAAVMLLREATLTLALAGQIVSLTWLRGRFDLQGIDWLIKAVLAVIVVRLTLNPWLLTYPDDMHWSLWTYGGSAILCFIAARMTADKAPIKAWLAAVSAQLLLLFLSVEIRYVLYDGNLFIEKYTLQEAAINTSVWLVLGMIYHHRASLSENLHRIYTIISQLLIYAASANFLLVLTVLNPLWGTQSVGTTPIFNLLLPAYALPPVLLWLACRWRIIPLSKPLLALILAGLFAFINLEIRHLWHRDVDSILGIMTGELYTYSAVWMLISVALLVQTRGATGSPMYRGGLIILLAVVAKLFLIDMADLDGLWRVASFMGLGLALLGVAYLHRLMRPQNTAVEPPH